MTVLALILLLQKQDPNRLIVLQKDSEGNGHSPLDDIYTAAYAAENGYSGKVGFEHLTKADRRAGYTREDVIVDGVPALVFVPVN